MSRFNNPRALMPSSASRGTSLSGVSSTGLSAGPRVVERPVSIEPRGSGMRPSGEVKALSAESSWGQQVGFWLLCIFSISAYLNEFAMRTLHIKAYVSTVAWYLLPVLLLLSGNALRAMRDVRGRLWLLFCLWMILAVPFSVWRGGSLDLLIGYIPHGWIQLYYFAAFVISVRHCRQMIHFMVAANLLLLVDCFLFGSTTTGRLEIPDSIFFTNANDLSLQLAISITQFLYLLSHRELWKRLLGGAATLVAMVFMFRTASRGAFLAISILLLMGFVFAKQRLILALVVVPVALVAFLFVPNSALRRLILIVAEPQATVVDNAEEESAVASQMQRMELFRHSVKYAITHPIFGVGPGQFAVAEFGDLAKEGKHAPWLGTHNSYTQVASECGAPAFLLYTSVILISLVSNFRMYRRAAKRRELHDISALALCLFGSTLVYAVCTFFYHIAYSSYLPTIAGLSIALRLSVDRSLWTAAPASVLTRAGAPSSRE